MEKMRIYNAVKNTPKKAQKIIEGGRLNGFTNINAMWRIEMLTELFGACGEGWYFEIVKERIVDGGTKVYTEGKGENATSLVSTEKVVYIDILLYYRLEDGTWSKGIEGSGGANIISNEKYAPYTDNDAFKKAKTDALGNACKQLGMSSDIFYAQDDSKNTTTDIEEDLFKKTVTKIESKQIVNAATNKWGHNAAERCGEILKKYGAKSSLELLQIYLPQVLKEIENASSD